MIVIRKACEADMLKLARWLRAERQRSSSGYGFWNNWRIIYEAFMDRRLFVLDLDGEPVGLLANGLYEPEIMAVRPASRCRGFGRLLAEFMIDYWVKRRRQRLEFHAIESSVPFWTHMGFRPVGDQRMRYGASPEVIDETAKYEAAEVIDETAKYEAAEVIDETAKYG